MTDFTPLDAAAGGVLIGLAAVWLMLSTGRIAGIIGILGVLMPPWRDPTLPERMAFVLGLVVAPLVFVAAGGSVVQTISDNMVQIAIAGLLVGFGTTLARGCTSGHGVCGLSRLSPRSLAATLTFMGAGMLTVFVMRHLG